MADFTIKRYLELIAALKQNGYSFQSVDGFVKHPNSKCVILRNDIDKKPRHALKIAKLQNQLGICSTFYFRINAPAFNKNVIQKIASLGHETGYHYEDIDHAYGDLTRRNPGAAVDENKLIDMAWEIFKVNLDKLRQLNIVTTICMHGSPLSRYDNKMLWKKYNYKDVGIICEPYLDIDFNRVAYFTDTGRKWNASFSNVRDKVNTTFDFNYRTTSEIIRNIERLPSQLMITIHPQRWNSNPFLWLKELFLQNLKNGIKAILKPPVEA